MKTHIALVLTCLILTACASRRDIASTHNNEKINFEQTQHAQMLDGQAASHVR